MTDESVKGTFDLTEWKEKGEQAYEELCREERELEAKLETLHVKKSELAKVLGKEPVTKRVRIRPALLALLEAEAKDGMEISEVCSRLIEENEMLAEKSIRVSLARLSKESDQVSISGEMVTFSVKKASKTKKS